MVVCILIQAKEALQAKQTETEVAKMKGVIEQLKVSEGEAKEKSFKMEDMRVSNCLRKFNNTFVFLFLFF